MNTATMTQTRLGRNLLCAVSLALCLLFAGCTPEGDAHEDLNDFVRNAGADMRGKVDPPPELDLRPAVGFRGTGPAPQPFDPARLKAGQRP